MNGLSTQVGALVTHIVDIGVQLVNAQRAMITSSQEGGQHSHLSALQMMVVSEQMTAHNGVSEEE